MKSFFVFLMFLITQTNSKSIDSRNTGNVSKSGGGDPLMWLLVQQITSLGSRLDKVVDTVNNFEKEIEEKNGVIISKVDEMSVKVEKSEKKMKRVIDEKLATMNALMKDKIDKVESSLKINVDGVNKAIDNKIKAIRGQLDSVKSTATQKRQGCQDGRLGAHAVPSPFPKSYNVRFSPAFESTPAVVTGLIVYDNDKNINDRLVIAVSRVTRQGFNVRIHTWSDTRLYGALIRWMACPKSV